MSGDTGLVVVRRLHRLVRHGFRPWLGYGGADGLDRTVLLKRRGGDAVLNPDGVVMLGDTVIAADDAAGFDARFAPGSPNRRNLLRRLYEVVG